jgi:large subunit ribosomal protein L4e
LTKKVVPVYSVEGASVGNLELPRFFDSPVRFDLIKRAVVSIQTAAYQPQGRDPMAGKRTTAESIGVGRAMARVPRVKGDRYSRSNMGALAPMTVKGRLTFPPVTSKNLKNKVNRKELRQAMFSALAATTLNDIVRARGHEIPRDCELPIVVIDDVERIAKSSEALRFLKNLRIRDDVQRASKYHHRAGRGSTRGRPLKHPVSVLLIVDKKQDAQRAFRNFTGVKVVDAMSLNVNDLAPGTHPGRLTIWTQSALKSLDTRLGGKNN